MNFKFVHGTHLENLPFILKNKIIYKSSDVKKMEHVVKEFGGAEYVYGNIIFEDIKLNLFNAGNSCVIIIDKKIMQDQEIIFNSSWAQLPIMNKKDSNNNIDKVEQLVNQSIKWESSSPDYLFSIWLDPEDSDQVTNRKLILIKKIIKKKIVTEPYFVTHEILFTKQISMKLYSSKVLVNNFLLSTQYEPTKTFFKFINKFAKKYKNKNKHFELIYLDAYSKFINEYVFE